MFAAQGVLIGTGVQSEPLEIARRIEMNGRRDTSIFKDSTGVR